MTTANHSVDLTREPDTVNWPEKHYVFVEKTGPFHQSAPQAWQEVHRLTPALAEHNSITGYFSPLQGGPTDIPRRRFRGGAASECARRHELRKISRRQI